MFSDRSLACALAFLLLAIVQRSVLYLGTLATIILDGPEPWSCADPAFGERLRRLALESEAAANRAKQTCKP